MHELPFDFADLWFDWRFQLTALLLIIFGALTAKVWKLLFVKASHLQFLNYNDYRIIKFQTCRPESLHQFENTYVVEFFNLTSDYRFIREPDFPRLDARLFAYHFKSIKHAKTTAELYLRNKNA